MSPNLIPLPVDALLPNLTKVLESFPAAVLTAEPGAGKTTRVPPALLSTPFLREKEIWVLQPRRVAAKMAALRVSDELGQQPGQQVGYQFRFEKKTGPGTRLIFMTDGMLIPLAQSDPSLSRVGAVILDEFHERSLALDLALAWLKNLQLTRRRDLKIIVMSATLDTAPLSQYFSGCPILRSPGRVFPVTVEYHPFPGQADPSQKVRSAVKLLVSRGLAGTFLTFLPGLGEIKRALQALSGEGWEVLPLYGDLSLEEQQRALQPSMGIKIILSTNLAETSLTVPGVTAVIDLGLNRQARVSPWSGMERLVTVPASQASAAQRAGRAGRLAPGVCLRLFTQFDFEHRAAFDLPEISRSDLSKTILDLKGLGAGDLNGFPWFLSPPPAALESAQDLLRDLDALGPSNTLTSLGRQMGRLPLAVRLARFLLAVQELAKEDSSSIRWACRLAAMLQEEESDSVDLMEELKKSTGGHEFQRLEDQLANLMNAGPKPKGYPDQTTQTLLAQGLLKAFPDRVAKVRESAGSKSRDRKGNQRELVLSQGGTVTAPDGALTRSHDLFVVVEAQEFTDRSQTLARARALCPIQEDWLLDFFPERLREEKELEWNAQTHRVEGYKRLFYRQLVLEEKPLAPNELGSEGQEMLFQEALAAGPSAYADPEELAAFMNRLRFAGKKTGRPDFPLEEQVREKLKELCGNRRSFEDLRSSGLVEALRSSLSPKEQALLEKLAPPSVVLSSGRRMMVHYEEGKPPWGESRIQDFFGMRRGPRVGEEAVVLHLLSPAKRPVQVTSDLAGFWEKHYPQLRKELSRRYPRHKWPENPMGV